MRTERGSRLCRKSVDPARSIVRRIFVDSADRESGRQLLRFRSFGFRSSSLHVSNHQCSSSHSVVARKSNESELISIAQLPETSRFRRRETFAISLRVSAKSDPANLSVRKRNEQDCWIRFSSVNRVISRDRKLRSGRVKIFYHGSCFDIRINCRVDTRKIAITRRSYHTYTQLNAHFAFKCNVNPQSSVSGPLRIIGSSRFVEFVGSNSQRHS